MVKVQKNILIHAHVEKVFAFMNDPRNLPEIWPSMVEVMNPVLNSIGGYNFEWVYKMAGLHFNGASKTTEFILNKRIITESTKGIESRFVWDYKAEGSYTKLSVELEYKIPIPLIGKLAETVIVKQNEHEADTLLKNLKDRMEIEAPVPV
jgi:uncharacterized membrane protein